MSSPDDSLLRVVIVGHVDHGKSTLTGRMLADAGALPDGKLDAIRKSCEKRGVPFEYAFVLDALQAERDQNITIDVSQVWLRTPGGGGGARPTVIIDAPGHREFLKNMVTGASSADAALLLVAADEGVREQTKRHATLLGLLGIKQVVVVVTKLDRVGFDRDTFTRLERDVRAFLTSVGIAPLHVIPTAARDGVNVAALSSRTPWYQGPTVLGVLDTLERPRSASSQPLRFFVQDVYRFDARRILAGRVESGTVSVGDRIRFEPGARTATVASLEAWGGAGLPPVRAIAGDSIGITLDEQIFVERGHVATHADASIAPRVSRKLRARIFWMGKRPLEAERRVRLRICTHEADARLVKVERVVDASTLDAIERNYVQKDDVAEVILETRAPLPIDLVSTGLASSSRFVIVDGYDVAGGGLVLDDLDDGRDRAKKGVVSLDERAARNGHKGAVVWLHAADAPLAPELERALFEHGVNAVLADERTAALYANAGLVALATGSHATPRGSVAALVDDVLAHTRIDRRSPHA